MKKIIIYLLLIVSPVVGKAQEYIYTLYSFTPINYNPSVVGMDNNASLSFLHQESEIGFVLDYTNNLITGEYPLLSQSGKRHGGIGFTVTQKDAGDTDLLNTFSAGLSLAYNLQLNRHQFISIGIKGSYLDRKSNV